MTNNGTKVKVAVMSSDIQHIKDCLTDIKVDLVSIKSMQQNNNNEILVAKASIRTLRTVFGILIAVVGLAVTVYAALK